MTTAHDKYFEPIKSLLRQRGSMGVNAIARELNVPVSTIQKWLERQNYFVKNSSRQWELPGEASIVKLNGDLKEVIDAQMFTIDRLHRSLVDQLESTVDLIKSYEIKPPQIIVEEKAPPVADIDSRLVQLDSDAKKIIEIFNKKDIKKNIPEEYSQLLNNYDHIGLIIKEGKDFATKFLEDEIFALLSGRITTLSEETLGILKENQNGSDEE